MHWNPAVGIPLLIIGLIVLALIWLFGRPRKPGQGRRIPPSAPRQRREPTFDDPDPEAGDAAPAVAEQPEQGELNVGMRSELERVEATLTKESVGAARPEAAEPAALAALPSTLGQRRAGLPVDRIVNLFVVAREGRTFHGSDLVVAMEKAGLEFGAMQVFHRLLDGKPEQGAVFSVANMVKPGSFTIETISTLETPGVSFFMTLPGPLPALDAWDTMLPTAQRLARLLEGVVLDEERNSLSHQRIAHIRDELRGWDRHHEVVL